MPINPKHPIFDVIAQQYEQERDPKLVAVNPELYASLSKIGANCRAIISGISEEGLIQPTFADAMRFTGAKELDQETLASMTFLSTCSEHVMNSRIEFIVDGEVVPLTSEQNDHVVSGKGPMPHPVTGEIIENPQECAFVRFDVVEGVFDWQPDAEESLDAH